MIKVAAILKRAIASVGYKKAVAAIVSLIATASVEYKKASASVVSKRAIAAIAFGHFYTFLRAYFLDSAELTDEDIIAFGKSLTHQGISQDDLFKSSATASGLFSITSLPPTIAAKLMTSSYFFFNLFLKKFLQS